MTPWTVAHRALLSMGFSRQEDCSGLLCPPRRDPPTPGIEPASLTSPASADRFFSTGTACALSFHITYLFPSLVAQMAKHLPAMRETWVRSLGREDPLEKEMATHSSILAWKILWTEEPGGLQSMGSQSQTRLSSFTSLPFTYLLRIFVFLKVEKHMLKIRGSETWRSFK